jgi:hypothetical protein
MYAYKLALRRSIILAANASKEREKLGKADLSLAESVDVFVHDKTVKKVKMEARLRKHDAKAARRRALWRKAAAHALRGQRKGADEPVTFGQTQYGSRSIDRKEDTYFQADGRALDMLFSIHGSTRYSQRDSNRVVHASHAPQRGTARLGLASIWHGSPAPTYHASTSSWIPRTAAK